METQDAMADQSSSKINFGPLFIGLAALLWTSDFFARNYLLDTEGVNMLPTHVVMLEHIIIVLVLSPFIIKYIGKMKQFNRNEWIAVLIIGGGASALATVFLSAGYALGFFSYAPIVALSQQFQPVIAIGLASLMLKERLPNYYYPLSLLAILGVFLMYWPTVSLFDPANVAFQTGILAAFYGLMAAFLWGSGTVLGKYLLVHSETKIEYFEMTNFRFFVGMVFLVGYNIIFEPFGNIMTKLSEPWVIPALLFIALIPGLLSLVLYYFGLKSTHASVATLFELAFPLSFLIFVPLLSEVIYDEPAEISLIQYAGAIILVIATTTLSYIYGKKTDPDQFEKSRSSKPVEQYPSA